MFVSLSNLTFGTKIKGKKGKKKKDDGVPVASSDRGGARQGGLGLGASVSFDTSLKKKAEGMSFNDFVNGGENNDDGFEYVSDKNLENNPIALAADTWTKVTNDGTSGSTKRQFLPEGVTRIYDVTTQRIKLDQLPTDGWLIFRFGVKVIPNVDNVTLKARIAYTVDGGYQFYLVAPGALLNDGAGIEYEEQFTLTFYVGDQESKDGYGELEVRADGTCSITDCAFMTIVG